MGEEKAANEVSNYCSPQGGLNIVHNSTDCNCYYLEHQVKPAHASLSHHPYCDGSCFHSKKTTSSPIRNNKSWQNLQDILDKDKRKNIELTFDMSKGAAIFTSGVIYAIISRILTRAQAVARLRSVGSFPYSENNKNVYKITDIDLWKAFGEDDQLTQFQSVLTLLPKMNSEGSFMDNQRISNLRNCKALEENSQELYKHGQNQLNKRRTQEQNLQLTMDQSDPFRAWHHAHSKNHKSQKKDQIGLYLKERRESLSENVSSHHSFQSPNNDNVVVHVYGSMKRSKSTAVTTSSFNCQSEPYIDASANTFTHTRNSDLPIACSHYRLFQHITAAAHFPNTPLKTEGFSIERPKVPKFPKASKEQNIPPRVIGHDFHTLTRLIMLIGVWWLCASWIV